MLGLLVLSVLIFTSFFRERDDGFLHSLKDTVTTVVTPVQDVAVAAVRPIEDAWDWFAELRTARSDARRLAAENELLTRQIASQVNDRRLLTEFREQLAIAGDGPDGYRNVTANVLGRPQFDISRRASLDKGSDAGIVVNSPVFAPVQGDEGVFGVLVGTVTGVTGNSSRVSFITDPVTRIGATLQGSATPLGLLRAESSGRLLLEQVPSEIRVTEGTVVVTAGFGTLRVPSPYPPGLPIGVVESVGQREPGEFQTVQVKPFRDPLELSTLTVAVPESAQAKRRAAGG